MSIFHLALTILGKSFEQEAAALAAEFTDTQNFNKGKLILKSGDSADSLVYLSAGICRGYLMGKDGLEHTTNFFVNPTFIADMPSFRAQRVCNLNIESLTDCSVAQIKLSKLYNIAEARPVLHKFFREILERAYIFQQQRQTSFITGDATTRYLELVEGRKQIFKEIPQKYIASYIGVTPQSLSRIRRRLSH